MWGNNHQSTSVFPVPSRYQGCLNVFNMCFTTDSDPFATPLLPILQESLTNPPSSSEDSALLMLLMFTLLGGSSHLVSGLVHPSYKWTLPPPIPFITRGITHLLSGMNHQVVDVSCTFPRGSLSDGLNRLNRINHLSRSSPGSFSSLGENRLQKTMILRWAEANSFPQTLYKYPNKKAG